MAEFTRREWALIRTRLNEDPQRYGLPRRVYGSAVLASFNIRKLGDRAQRGADTWQFLADVCRHFDLLAVQEVLTDMSGLRHLQALMGQDFGMVAADTTGAFPNEGGLAERLAFLFNWTVVNRSEMVTDVTYDRTKVMEILAEHGDAIHRATTAAHAKFRADMERFEQELAAFAAGEGPNQPDKPRFIVKMPVFLSFIRCPFAVMFEIKGHPGAERYRFMAINAHLYYGNYIDDRRQEFNALLAWIMGRVKQGDQDGPLNIVLLGDLNLDFDNPANDRARIEHELERLNEHVGERVNIYFPLLDPYPERPRRQLLATGGGHLRTNARLSQTFDQIGIFSTDPRLMRLTNERMGIEDRGPDYGVFDFANLFSEALLQTPFAELPKADKTEFIARFQDEVSDHMPLWFRVPLPDLEPGHAVAEPK